VVSYLGLNPREDSSGGHQRLGHISKQGNEMMRWLLVEAGQSAVQYDPELHRKYQRLKFRRGAKVAKVAIARHLAVRMYGTLRQRKAATSPVRMSGSPAQTLVEEASPSIF
jgi:transposase